MDTSSPCANGQFAAGGGDRRLRTGRACSAIAIASGPESRETQGSELPHTCLATLLAGAHPPCPPASAAGPPRLRARVIAAVAVCLLALAAAPAASITVTVPDDWPTIQQ